MRGGRALDAMLAALAVLVASWPLSTLLESPIWVRDVLLMVLAVAASGVAARVSSLRGWQVVTVQLVVVVLTASALFGRGHLWYGLPTLETADVFNRLIIEAMQTIQSYTAPAPTTRGMRLLVGASMGVAAVVVDALVVTWRSPSLAGLPLLAIFLTSAANSGSSLHPLYFCALAAVWLVLVARQGTSSLRRWSTTQATPLTPVRDSGDEAAASGYATVARSLGVAALVLAVVVPVALPHLPTRFLLSGLGRNDNAIGGGTGTVGFSQSLDLSADLSSRSNAPVLQYRSGDSSPPPLRVSVSSRYARGFWPAGADNATEVAVSDDPQVPSPAGLSDQVPRKRLEIDVRRNNLAAPNLATPYPLVSADMNGVAWGVDSRAQQTLVARRPSSYSVVYWRLEPSAQLLRRGGSGASASSITFQDLQVDRFSGPTVRTLAASLTTGKTTAYDKAMAIQEYLRASGGFSYSLTLAGPVTDADGNELGLDPLSNFLATKRGYCVQFATAMIMMARALDIPARMAKGFLPGSQQEGVWTVTAADAHAWPELYFQDVGWTRFEPTPSVRSGLAPGYATPSPQNADTSGGRAVDDVPTPTPTVTNREDSLTVNPGVVTPVDTAAAGTPLAERLLTGWGLVTLLTLLGLLGALVVPLASRWRRRTGVRAARTDAEAVEAQWQALTASLSDLGMPPGPSRTPRQLRDHYHRHAYLDATSDAALGRVVATLERARYAPPGRSGTSHPSIEPDAREIRKAVARTRPRGVRVRATLWPRSGIEQLRASMRRLGWRLSGPWQDLSVRLRQIRRRR